MNNETVMRMARECFADPDGSLALLTPELSRFAALVAAHEREECALMVQRGMGDWKIGMKVAEAIRARGEK